MSDLIKIKRRLDSNDIEKILLAIECEHIKYEQQGSLITAQLPYKFGSNNRRAVQVRISDYMSCYIRNRSDFEGDIFNLVSYIHFDKRGKDILDNLNESKIFICKIFGWNEFINKGSVTVKDYTSTLKELVGDNSDDSEEIIKNNRVISEDIMKEFYYYGKPLPYKGWIDEGISYRAQVNYGVGFCLDTKRIVFPLRNRFGKLVGVKGRIMKDCDDDRKYLYIYRCNSRYELFNFYIAHVHILLSNRIYIFEAEKSCMMAYSNGLYNTVAIGASDISKEQVNMIKELGKNVEIVLCYDNDKSIDDIENHAKLLKGMNTYAMYDTNGILGNKDSPIDKGFDVWNTLVENNIFKINL